METPPPLQESLTLIELLLLHRTKYDLNTLMSGDEIRVWKEGSHDFFEEIVTEFARGDGAAKSTEIRTSLLHRSERLRNRSFLYSMIHSSYMG